MLNLSPLFFTTLDNESCMHDELDLTPEQRAWIASARTDVRDCLRTGIPACLGQADTRKTCRSRASSRKGRGHTRR